MAVSRRYQLQNEAANRVIAELVEVAGVPPERRGYVQHLLTTVLKLLPLLVVIGLGFFAFEPAHFQPFNPSGQGALPAVSVPARASTPSDATRTALVTKSAGTPAL